MGKVTDRPSISIEITGGEALIGNIEERKQLASFARLRYADPLFMGRITAGWIVLVKRAECRFD